MDWFWLNIPLAAVIFAVVTGIPLWLVFKHPDTAPTAHLAWSSEVTRQPQPTVLAPASAVPAIQELASPEAAVARVGAAA
jgi:hypothetical protein